MRQPISLADYLTSRYVVEPMRLLDYCLINDGGVAMILTAGDRAHDHPKPPVHVLGVAQRAQLGELRLPARGLLGRRDPRGRRPRPRPRPTASATTSTRS